MLQPSQSSPRLAFLIRKFQVALERQHQRDTEILAGLVRALRRPSNKADADFVREFVRAAIHEKGN